MAANNQLRSKALRALRSKKAIEGTLAQRLDTLTILEGIYGKIEQATDQIALVSVVKTSTAVLRDLNFQIGKIENVEDMMENLRDEMTRVDEVSKVIGDAGQGDVVDENAIDGELESMMQQVEANDKEKAATETQKKLTGINLNVPSAAVELLPTHYLPGSRTAASIPKESEASPLAEGVTNALIQTDVTGRETRPLS